MNAEQKKPRLFYYEDAVGAYVPCPDKVENILELDSHFSEDGEEIEIDCHSCGKEFTLQAWSATNWTTREIEE